ncbi:MAG: hypothetical protein ACRDFB_03325 [Rhabdochlamydiaceae bacterium]
MSTRIPQIESPFKAPEVLPTVAPGPQLHSNITPVTQRSVYDSGQTDEAINTAVKNYQAQAQATVNNKYNAQLGNLTAQLMAQVRQYQGDDVFKGVNDATSLYDKAVNQMADNTASPDEKEAFTALAGQYKQKLAETAQSQISENIPRVEAQAFAQHVRSSMGIVAANFNHPAMVTKTSDELMNALDQKAKLNDWSPEMLTAQKQDIGAQIVDNVATQKTSHNQGEEVFGDLDAALKSGKINQDSYNKLKSKYDSSVATAQARQYFFGDPSKGIQGINHNPNFFSSDGQPKEENLYNYVHNREDLKGDQRHADKVWNDMWRFAKEEEARRTRIRNDAMRAWQNEVITYKQNYDKGGPDQKQWGLEQLLNQAPKFYKIGDPVEQQQYKGIAIQTYTNQDQKDDPRTIVELKSGVIAGTVHFQDVLNANLNPKDQADLMQFMADKNGNKGIFKTGNEQAISDDLALAKQHYAGDPDGYNNFVDQLYKSIKPDDTPEDIRNYYNEHLKQQTSNSTLSNASFWAKKAVQFVFPESAPSLVGQKPLGEQLENYDSSVVNENRAKAAENLSDVVGSENIIQVLNNMKFSKSGNNAESMEKELAPIVNGPDGPAKIQQAIERLKSYPKPLALTSENIIYEINNPYGWYQTEEGVPYANQAPVDENKYIGKSQASFKTREVK